MHDYRKPEVWRRAHEFVLRIYRITGRYPRSRFRGFVSQSQRAAASIPTNIVEGAAAQSNAEFRRFIGYAIASSLELEYHMLLARDLGYLDPSTSSAMTSELGEIRGMPIGLRTSLTG